MTQALRKLTATISKTNTICIFINQLREKIGVMFGNPETTTGGNALKFYASCVWIYVVWLKLKMEMKLWVTV